MIVLSASVCVCVSCGYGMEILKAYLLEGALWYWRNYTCHSQVDVSFPFSNVALPKYRKIRATRTFCRDKACANEKAHEPQSATQTHPPHRLTHPLCVSCVYKLSRWSRSVSLTWRFGSWPFGTSRGIRVCDLWGGPQICFHMRKENSVLASD